MLGIFCDILAYFTEIFDRITLSLCGLPNFMKRDVHIVAELGDPTNLELLQLVGTHPMPKDLDASLSCPLVDL